MLKEIWPSLLLMNDFKAEICIKNINVIILKVSISLRLLG